MNKIEKIKQDLEKQKERSNLYSFLLVAMMMIGPLLFISPRLFGFLFFSTIVFTVACAFNQGNSGGHK